MSIFRIIHVDIVHMERAMSNTKLAYLVIVANVLGNSAAGAQQRLTGSWLTEDKSSHIRFQPCGSQDCGQLVWLLEHNDPETAKPWRDKFNPDDALKRRPLIGLSMITGLKPASEGQWEGDLYNPLDGRTYSGRFHLLAADRLQLRGCAVAGLLCQTEVWTRVAP
jgi:uncharacterized protein (DUF2147 family)